ncbi:MAG TPA: tetratricopeptide repeat protein [Micromonosporaceae bacterium]|nr:tetratricopeptide repeat protein [Micromonosporaceae bacterium]
MSSDATSGETESADDFVQRAQLLAELGRYDEAGAEVGFAIALEPDNAQALVVLARVHLAADRATEALAAADTAVAAAPDATSPLVARALALTDLRRFGEAAQVADQLLARWPADPYAQRSAAAILGEVRNGQQALDAAWRAVQLAPEEAEGHLVLALVAARLELFGLAEQAYREALRLDPAVAEAGEDVGIIRLERRRYSAALARLAELAAADPLPDSFSEPLPDSMSEPLPEKAPEPAREPTAEPAPPGSGSPGKPASQHPRRPPAEALETGDPVRRAVVWSAGYTMIAVVLTGFLAAGNGLLARLFAAVAGVAGLLLGWRVTAGAPGLVEAVLPGRLRTARFLALSLGAALVAPTLLLVYAVAGTAWPLVLALAVAGLALIALLRRRPGGPLPRS